MGEKAITGIVAIITAVIGVAIIAVLVSKNAQTTGVISAAGQSFSSVLNTALSPVTNGVSGGLGGLGNLGGFTGGSTMVPLSYPFTGG